MSFQNHIPANLVEKEGHRLVFQDEFERPDLDPHKWLPFYLPHWSSRARSAPNYGLRDGNLILQITADQQPWCPEFDGQVKCSSIQTGEFAGPVESQIGQHRFNPRCTVREAQANTRLFTPQYGYFEMRARAVRNRRNHVALWMIGYEDTPEKSGEIAIFEIMGASISPTSSQIGYGVRKWSDSRLENEFYQELFPFDASRFHIYGLDWAPTHLDFYIDNQKVKTSPQSPDYPMQFMLGIYELPIKDQPVEANPPGEVYPKDFIIDYFRAYQRFEK